MTFDMIKPIFTEEEFFNSVAAKTTIIAGIIDGSIRNLHDAVKSSNVKNGGQIKSIFRELGNEARMLSNLADSLIKEGKTADYIITEVNKAAINFNAMDIKTMKIEVYGSVIEWKQAMSEV